jgi:hypothetical protein
MTALKILRENINMYNGQPSFFDEPAEKALCSSGKIQDIEEVI